MYIVMRTSTSPTGGGGGEHVTMWSSVNESYLHALYWSTLTLTTIGELPMPKSKREYAFVIAEFIFGLLLFSAILGHVANIVTNISAARKEFQGMILIKHVSLF